MHSKIAFKKGLLLTGHNIKKKRLWQERLHRYRHQFKPVYSSLCS